MTVNQLIDRLSKLSEDLEVTVIEIGDAPPAPVDPHLLICWVG